MPQTPGFRQPFVYLPRPLGRRPRRSFKADAIEPGLRSSAAGQEVHRPVAAELEIGDVERRFRSGRMQRSGRDEILKPAGVGGVGRFQVHGQDPLPNGANFSFTVAGFQNHFRIHHLLYRT